MQVYFVSLGCDKNLVDSEYMLGLLRDAGHTLTEDEAEAEAIVINTCCFIHDAKEESIETILEAASYKDEENGCCRVLIVTGCLAERYRSEITESIPEVDAILGTASFDEIVQAIAKAEAGEKTEVYKALTYLPLPEAKRINTTCGYTAYLKIADGCEKFCTYCVIPSIRGKYRSVPMERILSEAEQLAADGAKELILVAQETTLYGVDLYGKKMLPELLRKLCAIEGPEWIRLLYCYPEEITDELIAVMKEEKKICRYLDLPIQHASDTVLKRMRRKYTMEFFAERLEKLKIALPDLAVTSDVIVGFPGETEEEFLETYNFIRDHKFSELHVFPYSQRTGTPAARMDDQVDEEVKNERVHRLIALNDQLAKEYASRFEGEVLEVIPEERFKDGEGENLYVGYTTNYLKIIFEGTEDMIGQLTKVKITKAGYPYNEGQFVRVLEEQNN